MFSRLVKEYADEHGLTEQLREENQLEWIAKMNDIRTGVIEVINAEIIY